MSANIGDPLVQHDMFPEMADIVATLNSCQKSYIQTKILYDAVTTAKVSKELRTKVDDLLISKELQTCNNLKLNSMENCETLNILGLTTIDDIQLSYEDFSELRSAVDKRIISLHAEEAEVLAALESQSSELKLSNLSAKKEVLHSYIRKLFTQQQVYVTKLRELANILEEMVKKRSEAVPLAAEEKLESYAHKETLYRLRGAILDKNIRIKIFTECPVTLEAYRIALSDIQEAQIECKREIKDLTILKEQYEEAKCPEFDDILRRFKEYKVALEGLKQLYFKLKK